MSVSKYTVNGQEFFKVYVHVRSKNNRRVRMQKTEYGIATEVEAKRIERRLYKEAVETMARRDGLGYDWSDIVQYWTEAADRGDFGNKLSLRTIGDYKSALNTWTKHWFNKQSARLTIADGREVFFLMEEEDKAKTHQIKVKRIINQVYNWGVENRYIRDALQNPVAMIQLSKGEEKIPQILSKDEITSFLSHAKNLEKEWYPIWFMALHTGMRNGELFALRWDSVDLNKKIIYCYENYCPNTKTFGPTKGRYWRVIPISPILEKFLSELKHDSLESGYVLPRLPAWINGTQALILRDFLKSVGIKEVVFHALRACWATQMLSNGVATTTVMKIGGWKKLSTMEIYVRLAGVEVRGATDSLDFSHPESESMKRITPRLCIV
jgi:integrase